MIYLTNTDESIELVSGSAGDLEVCTTYVDHTDTGGTMGSFQADVAIATTTTIVAAPAASTERQVKSITVKNKGTAQNVTVQKEELAATFELSATLSLGTDEVLFFSENTGWLVYDTSGTPKQFIEANDLTQAVVWANVPDANITQSSVTQHAGAISHTAIADIGTNTHAQIDTHIADSTIHYADATADGNNYVRNNNSWVLAPTYAFGEYSGTFNASLGSFPAAVNQGDWYNCVVAGTVDGQTFAVGDTLIATVDTPSTTTYAGNWTTVPNVGIDDHTLLTNIGTNTHAQIDTHIADSTIHFTQAAISITKSQVSDYDAIANVVEDITPQLGGNLDVNGFSITTTGGGNIQLSPDTTGVITANGEIRAEDGSESVPAYSFTSATGSGLYTDGFGNINVANGGTRYHSLASIGLYSYVPDGEIRLNAGATQAGSDWRFTMNLPNNMTGNVFHKFPSNECSNGLVLVGDGTGTFGDQNSWRLLVEADISDFGTYLANVVEDTTPQLGANLDLNNFQIENLTGNASIQAAGVGSSIYLVGNEGDVVISTGPNNFVHLFDGSGGTGGNGFKFDTSQNVDVGQDNYVLTYNNTADRISLQPVTVVNDTTPQLGGNLDVNGNTITSASNGDVTIDPNGTGNVLLGNFEFDADQTVGASQDNFVMTYDNATGHVSLEEVTFGVQFFSETGADATYTLDQSATFEYTIEDAVFQTSTGTITGNVQIDGVSVTGLSSMSLSSTEGTGTATAANVVNVGDKVTIVFTSNSAAESVSVKLNCVK